jgi:hypothetical protein
VTVREGFVPIAQRREEEADRAVEYAKKVLGAHRVKKHYRGADTKIPVVTMRVAYHPQWAVTMEPSAVLALAAADLRSACR